LANAFFSPPGPWRRPSATFDRLERQLPRPGRLPGAGALGTSVQHPLGSSLTARAAAGPRFRTALSVYDFSGDLGKVATSREDRLADRALAMASRHRAARPFGHTGRGKRGPMPPGSIMTGGETGPGNDFWNYRRVLWCHDMGAGHARDLLQLAE
jgi:hypothetical protein